MKNKTIKLNNELDVLSSAFDILDNKNIKEKNKFYVPNRTKEFPNKIKFTQKKLFPYRFYFFSVFIKNNKVTEENIFF